MRKPAPLTFGQVAILHALADGNRFGFDIMDATGLTSGTVYPTLDRFESLGYVTSHWEDVRIARRDKRPPRRYFDLTDAGATALAAAPRALQEPQAGVAQGLARRTAGRVAGGMHTRPDPLLRSLLATIDAGRWLAPPARRREWHRQWRADVWHEWHWRTPAAGWPGDRARFVRRVMGALYHALLAAHSCQETRDDDPGPQLRLAPDAAAAGHDGDRRS